MVNRKNNYGKEYHSGNKYHKQKLKTNQKFFGDTKTMNGHVIQVRNEQTRNGEFQDSVDQLRLYSSINHKQEIRVLKSLFDDLEGPKLPEPEEPVDQKIKREDGTETTKKPSKFQETIYSEQVKQWMKDKRSLDTTLAPVYNIVWGQFSRLMRNKIVGMQDYEGVKNDCDVAKLLREIRKGSNRMKENTSI